MIITAYNPEVDSLEKTYLTSAIAAAASPVTLKVKNTNSFINGQRVLLGAPGRERSEMATQSSKTATTLVVGTTNFYHDASDPIYLLNFDQIRFYRSTTGINGTYSVLATVDVDWDNANLKTAYNDPNALDTYFYKVSFVNSASGTETELSVPLQATGYEDNSVGETLKQVIKELNDELLEVFDIPTWIGIMNNVSKDLYKRAKRPYRFLKVNVSLDVATGDDSVPFPVNMWKINYTEVNQYNAGLAPTTFRPKKIDPTLMRFRQSRMTLPSDYVDAIAYDDEAKELLFYPAARTDRLGAFNFHIYKKFTKFTDLSDLIETPDNLVYQYGMKRDYYHRLAIEDNKYLTQANLNDKMYQAEIVMLQREKNIEADGPTGFGPDRKRYPQFGIPRYRR